MYNLYTDKSELFECKISLEGSSIENSECRLVIESDDLSLLFRGKLNKDGKAEIPIKKLKGLMSEGTSGIMQLEVLADKETYFLPWQEKFIVKTNKKVTVEVLQKTENKKLLTTETKKPSIKVDVKSNKEISKLKTSDKDIIREFIFNLRKNNINLLNLESKKEEFNKIIFNLNKKYEINDSCKNKINESFIRFLKL